MDLRVGDIIFGAAREQTYKIISPCGQGSFGVVFKIQDAESNQFALKTIATGLLDEATLAALQNEGNLSTQIMHPNALRVFYFHDGKTHEGLPPYMIMEFADGGTLLDLISSRQGTQKQFTNEELSAMFKQLASGMKAINEKLVHRDIKPDNILISGDILKYQILDLQK